MKFVIVLLFYFYSSSFAKLDTQWWKNTIIYELIPYAFKDSNGDGIGDLKGITSKLPHFMDLRIDTIHLTPMFKTTFRDIGYDVTDFYDIDPRFGTMEDFEVLISEMNKRGMKLILDWVINHSGSENEWFKKSIDRIEPYTDFYIWKDSKGFDNETGREIPPNNWYSLFGGSAWKWNEKRKQFYFHQFLEEQVDFNLRNPIVKEELKKMIKFWLDKGVAGFRLDAVLFMMEDEHFRDNGDTYWQCDEEGTYKVIHEFREFLDEYNQKNGGIERIFIAEAHGSIATMQRFYDQDEYHITHFPYNFVLRYIYGETDAESYHQVIINWMKTLPKNAVSTWITEDHDGYRTGNRIRPEFMDILTITAMLLPGNAGCYYGQEIGMTHGYITADQMVDNSGGGSRDPARLLMQWENTLNAGFSKSISTIVPSNSDYFYKNVEDQKKQKVSHYNLFKNLSSLRKTETFIHGDIQFYIPSKYIFIFTRAYKDRLLAVIINFDSLPTEVNLNEAIPLLPKYLSIVAASVNAHYTKGYEVNEEQMRSFVMMPYSGIVIEGSNSNE